MSPLLWSVQWSPSYFVIVYCFWITYCVSCKEELWGESFYIVQCFLRTLHILKCMVYILGCTKMGSRNFNYSANSFLERQLWRWRQDGTLWQTVDQRLQDFHHVRRRTWVLRPAHRQRQGPRLLHLHLPHPLRLHDHRGPDELAQRLGRLRRWRAARRGRDHQH